VVCVATPQVLSRVVSHGLDGRKLRATFKEADQLDYQDSLGQLVLGVCNTVPDGVLLFLPSYALMEKLTKRWQVCVDTRSTIRECQAMWGGVRGGGGEGGASSACGSADAGLAGVP
jgi:Fanconi anemia group J protein